MTKEKMTDGLAHTFWHSSANDREPWVNYALNTIPTITKVTVGVRSGSFTHKKLALTKSLDCCQDRYKHMCVTLKGKNGSKLAEKCTVGNHGEPFLVDEDYIVVPFSPSVKDVTDIRISFNDGKYGQVQSLIVEGYTSSGKKTNLTAL